MGDIKYPELYNIFSEWAEYMKATRKRKLVVRLWVCFGVTFLLGLFLGCFFSNATRMIYGSIMALGLFIYFIKDLFLLARIEKNDEDIDKYINMASANAKRYYLVPNDTTSIMQVVGDIDVDYFELIEESIKRGICFGSPFVYVTDEYVISRSSESLKFNPVIVPKSLIEDMLIYDKHFWESGWLKKFNCLDIHIMKNSDKQRVRHLKRVIIESEFYPNKNSKLYKQDDPFGLKCRHIELTKK